MKRYIIIILITILIGLSFVFFLKNRKPSHFQLKKAASIHYAQDITLHWQKSESRKNIKYKLIIGQDSLLQNKETNIIENITDTFCSLTNLKKGQYYWQVIASDGKNKIRSDSTKNTFNIIPLKEFTLTKDTTLLKKDSPHHINRIWIIKKGVNLNIQAGCKLILAEGVNIINYGNIYAKGNPTDSIWFIPQKTTWGEFYSHDPNCNLEFDYCYIKDALFRSTYTNVSFSNCTYILHHKSLTQDGIRTAILWSYRGTFSMNHCYFENKLITTGEGMAIEQAQTSIRHSVFKQMADAVEFLNVNDGIISDNIIINSPDDAIDMNGCSNILIKNNILINNKDKAISVGTEQYGPSFNIDIRNNFIINNNCGISVKDSSFCTINKNSFIENETALDARLKNNWKQYKIGGNAKVINCIFYKNHKIVRTDDKSAIFISHSISEIDKIRGSKNKIKDIKFTNKDLNNYNTSYKNGAQISETLISKYNKLKK